MYFFYSLVLKHADIQFDSDFRGVFFRPLDSGLDGEPFSMACQRRQTKSRLQHDVSFTKERHYQTGMQTFRGLSFAYENLAHLPVRSSHTGLPLLSRNISVSVPFTISRARIISDVSCFTFDPVMASSSPLMKLIPISS